MAKPFDPGTVFLQKDWRNWQKWLVHASDTVTLKYEFLHHVTSWSVNRKQKGIFGLYFRHKVIDPVPTLMEGASRRACSQSYRSSARFCKSQLTLELLFCTKAHHLDFTCCSFWKTTFGWYGKRFFFSFLVSWCRALRRPFHMTPALSFLLPLTSAYVIHPHPHTCYPIPAVDEKTLR
jgi:hypothetical protein